MVPHIVFHDPKTSRTVTVKTEREPIAIDKEYTLTGPSSTLLNQNNIYEEITKVKTPFLLGVPRLIIPKPNEVINEKTVSYFEISEVIYSDEFRGKVTHIEWVVAQDENFETIIYQNKNVYENEESKKLQTQSINLSSLNGGGFVKARYLSGDISSPFTKAVPFKVLNKVILKPSLTEFGKGINKQYELSPFSINSENGRDTYSSTQYKVYKIPNDKLSDVHSYYSISDEYLLTDFNKVTENGADILKFPLIMPDGDRLTLKAGDHTYVVQARHKGKIYTSELTYITINASGLRVRTPELYIRDNELRPILGISKFKVPNGEDTFTNHQIFIYEIEKGKEVLIHNVQTTETEYVIPENVCKSEKKYRIEVITNGTDYLPSLPGKINFTMPKIGIIKPLINLQNLGMEPKFTISPFKTVNCTDKWVGTEWELFIHGKLINSNLEPISSLIKTYYTEKDISVLQLLKTDLEPNTNYIMKVRFVGEKYKSDWSAINFKSTELEINKPVVTAKVNGLNIELDISDYIVKGATDTGKEVWYYIAKLNNALGEDVYEQIGEPIKVKYYKKKTIVDKSLGITKDTRFKIVGKIVGEYFSTPLSDPIYVKTDNIFIKPPVINITGAPDRVPKRPIISTSVFTVSADNDKHIGTTYIIKELQNDQYVEVYRNEKDSKHLTELILLEDILKVKTNYTLTVIHYGAEYGPSESVTISFRTRNSFMEIPIDGEDGLQNIIIGSDELEKSPKYFGTISYSSLNNDRNYLGNWDGKRVYLKGEQVFYNNTLWYSTRNNNENRVPGVPTPEGIHYWKKDDRWNLPTYKWLLKHIGFPAEVEDSNDGLSEGYNYVGSYKDNVNSDVIKVALDGRILYIYNKIELENICYNDLVKMNLHSKRSRTIRISQRLYYLRTLTSREVNELRKLKLLDINNLISIDIHNPSFVSDEDQHDTEFRLVSNEQYKVEPHNAIIRDMGLRLVLEYIPEEQEPWKYYKNNEPKMQYDKYTDTGYFGSIDECNINLYDQLGIITGTKINGDMGFLVFYYHGKKLIISRKPIVFGIGYQDLFNIGVLYDPNAITPEGYTPAKISNLKIKDNIYINGSVRIPKGGAFTLGNQGLVENNYIKANDNLCRYSEWNELIYRVSTFEPKWIDTNYSHGGFQIGSNWDNYDNINLGVFEHYSGNGCFDYVMTSVNNNCIASRGGIRLEALYWINKSDIRNDHGLRIVIEDLTKYIPNDIIPKDKPDPVIPWVPINPNTVIKTDPLTHYTLANVNVNNFSNDYNIYKFKEPYNKEVNDTYIRYQTGNTNLLSPVININNALTIKVNNMEYMISNIEEIDSKADNIIKEKPFFVDGLWYMPNRPTLVHYNNLNNPSNTIYLFFGTLNKIYKIVYDKNLNTDKDKYLRTLVDNEGNGNKINSYTYSTLNINTPRSEIYNNNIMKTPTGIFNEIVYLEMTNHIITIEEPIVESIPGNTFKISNCDDDYKVFIVKDTYLNKVTDENIKYKVANRPTYNLEELKEYSLNTRTFLKVDNKLYRMVNITLFNINDLDYIHTSFKRSGYYYFPNDNSIIYQNDTKMLILYHGYRLEHVNSTTSDMFVKFQIDDSEDALLGLTVDIVNNDEQVQEYLLRNNFDYIKVITINSCASNFPEMLYDQLAQYKGLSINKIVKAEKVIPEPEPKPEPEPPLDYSLRGIPFANEEYSLGLKLEEHIQLSDGTYGDLYKLPKSSFCVFKSNYYGKDNDECVVIGIMNYAYAKDQTYEFLKVEDLPKDELFKTTIREIINSLYPEISIKNLPIAKDLNPIPDNPYITLDNNINLSTNEKYSPIKNPRPTYVIIDNDLYLDISYKNEATEKKPLRISYQAYDITDNLFSEDVSIYKAHGFEKIARVDITKTKPFILVYDKKTQDQQDHYKLHIEYLGKEICKSNLVKVKNINVNDFSSLEELLKHINKNSNTLNIPKSDLISKINTENSTKLTSTEVYKGSIEEPKVKNRNIRANYLELFKITSFKIRTDNQSEAEAIEYVNNLFLDVKSSQVNMVEFAPYPEFTTNKHLEDFGNHFNIPIAYNPEKSVDINLPLDGALNLIVDIEGEFYNDFYNMPGYIKTDNEGKEFCQLSYLAQNRFEPSYNPISLYNGVYQNIEMMTTKNIFKGILWPIKDIELNKKSELIFFTDYGISVSDPDDSTATNLKDVKDTLLFPDENTYQCYSLSFTLSNKKEELPPPKPTIEFKDKIVVPGYVDIIKNENNTYTLYNRYSELKDQETWSKIINYFNYNNEVDYQHIDLGTTDKDHYKLHVLMSGSHLLPNDSSGTYRFKGLFNLNIYINNELFHTKVINGENSQEFDIVDIPELPIATYANKDIILKIEAISVTDNIMLGSLSYKYNITANYVPKPIIVPKTEIFIPDINLIKNDETSFKLTNRYSELKALESWKNFIHLLELDNIPSFQHIDLGTTDKDHYKLVLTLNGSRLNESNIEPFEYTDPYKLIVYINESEYYTGNYNVPDEGELNRVYKIELDNINLETYGNKDIVLKIVTKNYNTDQIIGSVSYNYNVTGEYRQPEETNINYFVIPKLVSIVKGYSVEEETDITEPLTHRFIPSEVNVDFRKILKSIGVPEETTTEELTPYHSSEYTYYFRMDFQTFNNQGQGIEFDTENSYTLKFYLDNKLQQEIYISGDDINQGQDTANVDLLAYGNKETILKVEMYLNRDDNKDLIGSVCYKYNAKLTYGEIDTDVNYFIMPDNPELEYNSNYFTLNNLSSELYNNYENKFNTLLDNIQIKYGQYYEPITVAGSDDSNYNIRFALKVIDKNGDTISLKDSETYTVKMYVNDDLKLTDTLDNNEPNKTFTLTLPVADYANANSNLKIEVLNGSDIIGSITYSYNLTIEQPAAKPERILSITNFRLPISGESELIMTPNNFYTPEEYRNPEHENIYREFKLLEHDPVIRDQVEPLITTEEGVFRYVIYDDKYAFNDLATTDEGPYKIKLLINDRVFVETTVNKPYGEINIPSYEMLPGNTSPEQENTVKFELYKIGVDDIITKTLGVFKSKVIDVSYPSEAVILLPKIKMNYDRLNLMLMDEGTFVPNTNMYYTAAESNPEDIGFMMLGIKSSTQTPPDAFTFEADNKGPNIYWKISLVAYDDFGSESTIKDLDKYSGVEIYFGNELVRTLDKLSENDTIGFNAEVIVPNKLITIKPYQIMSSGKVYKKAINFKLNLNHNPVELPLEDDGKFYAVPNSPLKVTNDNATSEEGHEITLQDYNLYIPEELSDRTNVYRDVFNLNIGNSLTDFKVIEEPINIELYNSAYNVSNVIVPESKLKNNLKEDLRTGKSYYIRSYEQEFARSDNNEKLEELSKIKFKYSNQVIKTYLESKLECDYENETNSNHSEVNYLSRIPINYSLKHYDSNNYEFYILYNNTQKVRINSLEPIFIDSTDITNKNVYFMMYNKITGKYENDINITIHKETINDTDKVYNLYMNSDVALNPDNVYYGYDRKIIYDEDRMEFFYGIVHFYRYKDDENQYGSEPNENGIFTIIKPDNQTILNGMDTLTSEDNLLKMKFKYPTTYNKNIMSLTYSIDGIQFNNVLQEYWEEVPVTQNEDNSITVDISRALNAVRKANHSIIFTKNRYAYIKLEYSKHSVIFKYDLNITNISNDITNASADEIKEYYKKLIEMVKGINKTEYRPNKDIAHSLLSWSYYIGKKFTNEEDVKNSILNYIGSYPLINDSSVRLIEDPDAVLGNMHNDMIDYYGYYLIFDTNLFLPNMSMLNDEDIDADYRLQSNNNNFITDINYDKLNRTVSISFYDNLSNRANIDINDNIETYFYGLNDYRVRAIGDILNNIRNSIELIGSVSVGIINKAIYTPNLIRNSTPPEGFKIINRPETVYDFIVKRISGMEEADRLKVKILNEEMAKTNIVFEFVRIN